jgi:rod shape-determining protein MreC
VRPRTRFRSPLIIALTLLLVFTVLSLSLKRLPLMKTVEGLLVTVTAPLLKGLNAATGSVARLWRGYFYLVGVQQENQELKRKLEEHQQKEARYEETLLALGRLEALLNLKKQIALPVIGARVIAYDPTLWSRCAILDQGKEQGVRVGLPVLAPGGIVGRVVDSYNGYAKVMLIVDRNSGADAVVQRTRVRGILQGKGGNRCSLEYVPKNADVLVGDLVVASGLGGIYPAGLVFGRVTQASKKTAGVFQEVEVTPAVDLSALEEVLIVKAAKLALTP